MKRITRLRTLAATLCALAAMAEPLSASDLGSTTISFDEIPPSGNPQLPDPNAPPGTLGTWTFGDFQFTSAHFHTITDPPGGSLELVDNGTPYLFQEGSYIGQPIVISRVDGLPFALISLDLGEGFIDAEAAANQNFGPAESVSLYGLIPDGTSFDYLVSLDGQMDGLAGVVDFQNFVLPEELGNVTSVTLHGNGGPFGVAAMALDNVVVGPPIAEPSSAALVLLGGIALIAYFRKRPSPARLAR